MATPREHTGFQELDRLASSLALPEPAVVARPMPRAMDELELLEREMREVRPLAKGVERVSGREARTPVSAAREEQAEPKAGEEAPPRLERRPPFREGKGFRPFERLAESLPALEAAEEAKPVQEPLPYMSNERELLDWAMREVRPLPKGAERVSGREARTPAVVDDDALAYAELKALVEGKLRFNLSDSDEYMEGSVEGLDSRVLGKLRRGKFAVQEHLDLHGMTRAEAKPVLARFIERCGSTDRRSLLIVHGRGLNSKDQQPVLKESVALWLTQGKLARWTLCFCTARPCNGGAGALYVLLRARPAPK